MRNERKEKKRSKQIYKKVLCLLAGSLVLLQGCSLMQAEDREKTELYLDKAQALYDRGKTDQAVELILETRSSDPLLQARRTWMLADMLGLTLSGIREELISGVQVPVQTSTASSSWSLLSVSPDNTKAMVLEGSAISGGAIQVMDLDTGEVLASFGDENGAAETDLLADSGFCGGCFKSDKEVLLWRKNELFQYNLEDLTKASIRTVLGLEEPQEEKSDEPAEEKKSLMSVFEPEDGELQNITAPEIKQVRPAGEKLYVLTDGGAAMLNAKDLIAEKQVYSRWVEFGFSPVWDVQDGKAAAAAAEVDLGISVPMEAQGQQKSGIILIDFNQDNPEIQVISDQLTASVSWGAEGNLYALQYENTNPDDFNKIYIAPEKIEFKLTRFEGQEKKAQSETIRLMNSQADVPPVFCSCEAGEFITVAAGNEVQWRNPETLETDGSTVVMNEISSMWEQDGSLRVCERGGIMEKLAKPGIYPVTQIRNETVYSFFRDWSGSLAARWEDGQSAGIASLQEARAAQRAVLDCENSVRTVSYLEDPVSGNLMRLIVEYGQVEAVDDHREVTVRCSVGVSGTPELVWEKELLVSNQYDDSFGYENMVYQPLMNPSFALGADAEGIYVEYVSPSEAGRVYLSQPDRELAMPCDRSIFAGASSDKSGLTAVSTEDSLEILSFDPMTGKYAVEKDYDLDAPINWMAWNADGDIVVAMREDEIWFLNTETDEWIQPEGLGQDTDQGKARVWFSPDMVLSMPPAVLADNKNYVLFQVLEGDSIDSSVWIADLKTGRNLGKITPDLSDIEEFPGFQVYDSDFAAEDTQVILTDQSNTLYIWSVAEQKIIQKNEVQTFQNTVASPSRIQAEGDWVTFTYNGTIGYDYLSGSTGGSSAVYRNEKGILVPWLCFESAEAVPGVNRAIIQSKGQTVEVILPAAQEIEKAAEQYLSAAKEKAEKND